MTTPPASPAPRASPATPARQARRRSRRADEPAVFVSQEGGGEPPRVFDFAARAIARAAMRLPRYSWIRLFTRPLRRMAREAGAQYLRIPTADGAALDVAHFPPQPAGACPPPSRLPVIYAHGWIEVKEVHLREAMLLSRAGHHVLLVDLRAHGRSDGRAMRFGIRERHDLVAVIDACIEQGWTDRRVITMGFSLGGAVVLQHAGMDDRVAGVVAMAPFADARRCIRSFKRRWLPRGGAAWLERGFEQVVGADGHSLDEASPLAAMRRLAIPVLLVAGDRDRLLPPRDHAAALRACRDDGRCEYVHVPGAGHNDLCVHRWPGVDEAVVRFCARVSQRAAEEEGEPGS